MKIARVTNLVRALLDLKERGLWIYGFEPAASNSYVEVDYAVPCALVFGGEGQGIHRLVRESCDRLARIPLRPAPDPSRDTADPGNPLLDEAVTLASQSARNAAEHGRTGALTWRAYATRARTRTTPHGVFTGVTTATTIA